MKSFENDLKKLMQTILGISLIFMFLGMALEASAGSIFNLKGPSALDVDRPVDKPTVAQFYVDQQGIISDLNVSMSLGNKEGLSFMEFFPPQIPEPYYFPDTEPSFFEGPLIADPNGVYWTDLTVLISKEDGPTAVLFLGPHNDGFGAFDVTFDDEALNELAPFGDQIGRVNPATSLSVFDGTELSGNWRLIIMDLYLPGEGDELVSWGLSGTMKTNSKQTPVPEPSTVTLVALGLGGLILGCRRKTTF